MLKKLRMFYKKNRVYSILMVISMICILAILIGMISYFIGQSSKNNYGNRLDGIEKVEISNSKLTEIESIISKEEKVINTSIDIRGKLIYVIINLSLGTADDAKLIAQNSLTNFSDEQRAFYDIQYIISSEEKVENSPFPIMGYISASESVIKWTHYNV